MIGVFIDGPLAGTLQEMPPVPKWEVALPPRATICRCDPNDDYIVERPAETLTYYVILAGRQNQVAILSLKDDERAAVDNLKRWVLMEHPVDLNKTIYRDCRSERAFT